MSKLALLKNENNYSYARVRFAPGLCKNLQVRILDFPRFMFQGSYDGLCHCFTITTKCIQGPISEK